MEYIVKVLEIESVTHNVNRYVVEKPKGFTFIPGQATEVAINKDGFKDQKRPFTFTSLNSSDYLELTIKSYIERDAVTKALLDLKSGDEFIISEPFGSIHYQGKGIFIAGGAGITPFIAIFRELKDKNEIKGNTLIFSNKTEKDIIYKEELEGMFKDNPENLTFTVTQEVNSKYNLGRIDKDFLTKHISNLDNSNNYYICGPRTMVKEIYALLLEIGINDEKIVFER